MKRNDPKIHEESDPGCPVVSSTTIPQIFQNMSIINFNPQLKKYPHTSKTHKILEKVKYIPYTLITLDVKSLYTKIPNGEDIKAAKESYKKCK